MTQDISITAEDAQRAAQLWPAYAHTPEHIGGLYAGAIAAGVPPEAAPGLVARAAVETAPTNIRAKCGDFLVGFAFASQNYHPVDKEAK